MVGTDVAARGLDVDDIDVVIQMACRHTDSFVHRSGRTARKGKKGTNILFFSPDELKFVLNLEKELNIQIEFTNNIDDVMEAASDSSDVDLVTSGSSSSQSFGKIVDLMDKRTKNANFLRSMKVDKKSASQIYDALASDELDDSSRQNYIQFLIDFYVSKTYKRLDPVGFLTGKRNFETFGVKDIEYSEGMKMKDLFEDQGFSVKFARTEEDNALVEIIFDATESQIEKAQVKVDEYHPGARIEKIDVLPTWAKRFLLRHDGGYRNNNYVDKYGR